MKKNKRWTATATPSVNWPYEEWMVSLLATKRINQTRGDAMQFRGQNKGTSRTTYGVLAQWVRANMTDQYGNPVTTGTIYKTTLA